VQSEVKRYLTVYYSHIRGHNLQRGQYLQVLYLHIGFDLTIRHEYTPDTDLLPTIAQHKALEFESTLRIPYSRDRASVFPGDVLLLQVETREGETLLLGQRDTPL